MKKKKLRAKKITGKNDIKIEAKQGIKQGVKSEIKPAIKPAIKQEIKQEIKLAIEPAIKQDIKPVIKTEIKTEIKQLCQAFVKAWRPFSLTAAIIPTSLGSVAAFFEDKFDLKICIFLILGGLFIQSGVNLISDFFEFKQGILPEKNPNLKLTFKARRAYEYLVFLTGLMFFALSAGIGFYLSYRSGIYLWLIFFIGLLGGYFYKGKPFSYKDKGYGVVFVFFLMGILMVMGSYYAYDSRLPLTLVLIALPISCIVSLLLLSNELRDIVKDRENNLQTLSVRIGIVRARKVYLYLMLAPFFIITVLVFLGILSAFTLLTFTLLPMGLKIYKLTYSDLPQRRKIVPKTALFHFRFGSVQILAMVLGKIFSF